MSLIQTIFICLSLDSLRTSTSFNVMSNWFCNPFILVKRDLNLALHTKTMHCIYDKIKIKTEQYKKRNILKKFTCHATHMSSPSFFSFSSLNSLITPRSFWFCCWSSSILLSEIKWRYLKKGIIATYICADPLHPNINIHILRTPL